MQDDLIERLRDDFKRSAQNCEPKSKRAMIQERRAAADRIAALEAEVARLAALRGAQHDRYWEARYRDEADDNARLMGLVKEAGEALKAIQQRHGWCAGRCRACEKAATTLAKLKETTDG